MKSVNAKASRLKKTKWHEYLLRFVFGGLITAGAGWIAKQYGPVIGGLFLAFPAILPASASLVEKHKGHRAAGVEGFGAIAGSIGMAAFAAVVWSLATRASAWVVLPLATLVWLVVSAGVWWFYQWLKEQRRLVLLGKHRPKRSPKMMPPVRE
jgi:uncharacterized protein DUF3147